MAHGRLWRGNSQNSQNAAPDDGYDCYRESAQGNFSIAKDYLNGTLNSYEGLISQSDRWQHAILQYGEAIHHLLQIPESNRTSHDNEHITLCHHMIADLYAKQGLRVLAANARSNIQSLAQSQNASHSLRLSNSNSQ